jgi:drug/metabolite transporter (DMT)-like permease
LAAITTRTERRAVFDVLFSALLFAACNIAWRFGDGVALGVIAFRALFGAAVAALLGWRVKSASWRQPLQTKNGVIAVVISVLGLVAAGTMFRTLDGPLAGLALASLPAVALLVRDRSGRLATYCALGSSVAAIVGLFIAIEGESQSLTWAAAALAVAFVAIDVAGMRTTEIAMEEGIHPSAFVTCVMVCSTVVLMPLALVTGSLGDGSVIFGSIGAALAVAIFGTVGRLLRAESLPAAGVAATAASTQINALATAIGGIVIFSDDISLASLVATLVAAALGATAVVSAAHWRLRRNPELALPLEP